MIIEVGIEKKRVIIGYYMGIIRGVWFRCYNILFVLF